MTNTKRSENTTRSEVFSTKFSRDVWKCSQTLSYVFDNLLNRKFFFFVTERFSIKCHKNHRGYRLSNEQMKSRTKTMCQLKAQQKCFTVRASVEPGYFQNNMYTPDLKNWMRTTAGYLNVHKLNRNTKSLVITYKLY